MTLPSQDLETGEPRMTPPRPVGATASDLSPTIWTTSDGRRAQNSTRSLQPFQQNPCGHSAPNRSVQIVAQSERVNAVPNRHSLARRVSAVR